MSASQWKRIWRTLFGDTYYICCDGVDDEQQLMEAIDFLSDNSGGEIYIPAGVLSSGNILVEDKSNIHFRGAGKASQINLSGTAAGDGLGFQLKGTVDAFTLSNLFINGDGVVGNKHCGLWNASGQTISNVMVYQAEVANCMKGLGFSASLGGSYSNVWVEDCYIHDIVGTAPGQGYGIHFGKVFSVVATKNILDNCARHAIYQGKGANVGVAITGNIIKNHRKDVASNQFRVAVSIGRSTGVLVADNIFVDGYDGSLNIVHDESLSLHAKDVLVRGNLFINKQNHVPDIAVGSQGVPATYITSAIQIVGNHFRTDRVISGGGENILIFNGQDIKVAENSFHWENVAAAVNVIGVGHNSFIDNTADCTDIDVFHNFLVAEGADLSNVDGVQVCKDVCGNTANVNIKDNYFKGMSTNVKFVASLTNPNVLYDTRRHTQGAAAPTAGTWAVGDIVWEDTPAAGATPGWVCVTAGTPGTWKAMADLAA